MPEMWELPQAQSDFEHDAAYGKDTCPKCGGLLAHHHGDYRVPECTYCTEDNCDYVD